MEYAIIAIALLIAVGLYFGLKQRNEPPAREWPPKPGKNGKPKFPVASPEGPKSKPLKPHGDGLTVQGDAAFAKISATRSRIYIIPDKPWQPKGDSTAELQLNVEQGFATGDGMRIVVEVRDDAGNPVAAPVRGIIDLATGSALPTDPPYRVADPDGTAVFFYTMRAQDQMKGGAKLITAAILDGENTVTPKPAVLADVLTETDPNNPFFRGQ